MTNVACIRCPDASRCFDEGHCYMLEAASIAPMPVQELTPGQVRAAMPTAGHPLGKPKRHDVGYSLPTPTGRIDSGYIPPPKWKTSPASAEAKRVIEAWREKYPDFAAAWGTPGLKGPSIGYKLPVTMEPSEADKIVIRPVLERQQHRVKCWPEYFQAVLDGRKTFEARWDDRGYQEGDGVTLIEWDPNAVPQAGETGRTYKAIVGYVLRGPGYGVEAGHCIFSILKA